MGRGYLEGGVWKSGWAPPTLKSDPSFSTKQLDPTHKYVLYVAYICPFAHSANIARVLKGLEGRIDVVFLDSVMGEEGWTFGTQADPIHPTFKFLHQVYTHSKKDFTGRVTVPALYDVTLDTIVSSESVECIELFNEFGGSTNSVDLLAPSKDAEYENIKKRVLKFNGGVYAAGLATTQQGYEQNVNEVFDTLAFLEDKLAVNRFVFGSTPSLVDIRVFITYLRFIYVYRLLFKLDKTDFHTYKNLNRFLLDFYQSLGIQSTVNVAETKEGYYKNFDANNKHGIVPIGPDFDLNTKF